MLGLGFLPPSMMIAMQGIKLHLAKNRCKTSAVRMINRLKEQMQVKSGLSRFIVNEIEVL